MVYSYCTDKYRNGSAAGRLVIGRLAEVEYVVLSLGAFLRTVEHGPASRLAHEQMVKACAGRGVLLPVPGSLIGQWFLPGLFAILRDMYVDPVLALLAIARCAEVNWDAKPDLDWFRYKYDQAMISVLPALAPFRRVSASDERIEDGGTPMRIPVNHPGFANRGMSKAYARKAWKCFTDTCEYLTVLPMLADQDALMAEEEEVAAVMPAVAAVPTVDVDALLLEKEDDDWELQEAVGLDEVERVGA